MSTPLTGGFSLAFHPCWASANSSPRPQKVGFKEREGAPINNLHSLYTRQNNNKIKQQNPRLVPSEWEIETYLQELYFRTSGC